MEFHQNRIKRASESMTLVSHHLRGLFNVLLSKQYLEDDKMELITLSNMIDFSPKSKFYSCKDAIMIKKNLTLILL